MSIVNCVKAGVNLTVYLGKKFAPQILMGVSTVTGIGAIVWTAKNSYEKMPEIMEEYNDCVENIDASDELDEREKIKEKCKVRRHTIGRVCKTYAGPALMEGASIGTKWLGWSIQHDRTVEAIAYGAGLAKILNDYRGGVRERYGEDVDRELYYGMKDANVEKTIIDEKGKEKTVTETLKVANGDISGLRRYIVPGNPHYCGGDFKYVQAFCSRTSDMFTERLQHRDYNVLPLNEIFEYLLVETSADGMTNGFFYDRKNPNLLNKVEIIPTETTIPDSKGNLIKAFAIDIPIDGNVYAMTAGMEGK